MGNLRILQQQLEQHLPNVPSQGGLNARTGHLREMPSKVGLSILGFRLLVLIAVAVLVSFVYLALSLPKFDYIVEKRLGDHYHRKLSRSPDGKSMTPRTYPVLTRPEATDMDQDKHRVFLATRGHGIQALDKSNSLWSTYDAVTTGGQLQNDITEVRCGGGKKDARLWALGFDGSVSVGLFNGEDINFQSLYGSGFWHYITREEITAAVMVAERYVFIGTSSKGAGVYNLRNHQWLDLPEIANTCIRKIVVSENIIWFLTNVSVDAYAAVGDKAGELKFRFLRENQLKEENMKDLSVFGPQSALAFAEDGGCHVFKKGWSQRLLGGEGVPGISQSAIRFAFSWEKMIVVVGESFGVAGYDTDIRRWSILKAGPLPALHGFDHDEHTIALASKNGLYLIRKSDWSQLLEGQSVSKVSLWDDGCLYMLADDHEAKEKVGWISPAGHKKIIISHSALDVSAQPRITDVIYHLGKFWIGCEEEGVILYSLEGRRLEQANMADQGQIRSVKRLCLHAGSPHLLSAESLYRWDDGKWRFVADGVVDVKSDPKSDELWIQKSDGTFRRRHGSVEEKWFQGSGPEKLDPEAAHAAFIASGEDPKICYADLPKRKFHEYHIRRGVWDEPREIPGRHSFRAFAITGSACYSVSPSGGLYRDDQLILGGESRPGFSLATALDIKQPKGINSSVTVFGPRERTTYEPKSGSWADSEAYPFLKAGEELTELYQEVPAMVGKLARTSQNRLLVIKEDWKNAIPIPGEMAGNLFDGSTFWGLTRTGSLSGSTLGKREEERIEFNRTEFFVGNAPDLYSVLAAWPMQANLYLVTPSTFCWYDTRLHSWRQKELPDRAIDARVIGRTLEIVSKGTLYRLKYPSLEGTSIPLPRGDFKKVNSVGNRTIATTGDDRSRRVYVRTGDSWSPLALDRNRFEGNLGEIAQVYEHGDSLWVYDPAGMIGRYTSGNWSNFKLAPQFNLRTFWQGPGNHLFLVGRRANIDQTDFPTHFLGSNGFEPLDPLPATVEGVRLEKDRFLWVMSSNGDVFIYDLQRPQDKGISLLNLCMSAKNGTSVTTSYDFLNRVYSRTATAGNDKSFVERIAVEAITDFYVERDPKTLEITKAFLKTRHTMYCFEVRMGEWFLTAEARVSGSLEIDEAMKRIKSPGKEVEPRLFRKDRPHFKLSLSEEGSDSCVRPTKGEVTPGRFLDQPTKDFSGMSVPTVARSSAIKAVISDEGVRYFAITSSGREIEIHETGGRFETDLPVIDATVNTRGEYVLLRDRSLTTYAGDDLAVVADLARTRESISASSFLNFRDGRNHLHTPDGIFSVDTRSGEIRLTKQEETAEIYSNAGTGLSVKRDGSSLSVKINGQPFLGRGRFPFDEIKSIAVAKSKLCLLTSDHLWTFSTSEGLISDERYLELPTGSSGPVSLVTCAGGFIKLRVGKRFYDISDNLKETTLKGCAEPRLVASEDGWQWFLNPEGKGVLFEAQIAGERKRVERQGCEACGFLDDKYSWVVSHNDRVYAAHGLGIVTVSQAGKDNQALLGKRIEQLKRHGDSLLALSSDSEIFRDTKRNSWEREKAGVTGIFSGFTELYADPFVKVESFEENIRLRTSEDLPVHFVEALRKFKVDLPRDFASIGGRLFVINGQDARIISYDRSGNRLESLAAGSDAKRLEARDGILRVVTEAETMVMDPQGKETEWKKTASTLNVPGPEGFGFQFDLSAPRGEAAIWPVVAGNVLKQFWEQGAFAFDRVLKIEGGSSSWWALSHAGLLEFRDRETAIIRKIHLPQTSINQMAQRQGALHVRIGDTEKRLDEKTGEFVPAEPSAFTKTVFDLTPEAGAYSWKPVQVPEEHPRLPFLVGSPGGKRDENVFLDNRFSWDQAQSGAYDEKDGRYWLINPKSLTLNSLHMEGESGSRLALHDFLYVPSHSEEGFTPVAATFHGGNLFLLLMNNRNEEMVAKRAGDTWIGADAGECPFLHPAVEFNLRDHLWKATHITTAQFRSRGNTFVFIGPDDYPLFTELEWANGYGKFSFDYLLSIQPAGDTLWAGSKGGFLKFRQHHTQHASRLELEQIFLPEDGLNHYQVAKLRKSSTEGVLHLLERADSGEETVQELAVHSWAKAEPKDFKEKDKELRFPGESGMQYVFSYDPVSDRGLLSLQMKDGRKIGLLNCAATASDNGTLSTIGPGRFRVRHGKEEIEFGVPDHSKGEAFSRLTRLPTSKTDSEFKTIMKDPTGISWGEFRDAPSLRLPDGEIFSITGAAWVASLTVDHKALVWIAPKKDGEAVFRYEWGAGNMEEVKETGREEIEWVEYIPPPGTGILHYLEKSGLVKERGWLKGLAGRPLADVERWVLLIAGKNKIPKSGPGSLDYQLNRNTVYLMPRKAVQVKKIEKKAEFPLIVADRTYKVLGGTEVKRLGLVEGRYGIWAVADKQILRFDSARNRVFFEPLPTTLEPRRLWIENDLIVLSCVGETESNVWRFTPQQLRAAEVKPNEFRRVAVTKGNRTLEAAPDSGLLVGAGGKSSHVLSSSEWFFGTKINKVVKILEDSEENGFWIATDTSGLIWSQNPF